MSHDAAGHVDQLCCSSPWALAKPGIPVETVQLYRWFPSMLQVVEIIRPETLIRWHRTGFRSYWRWKSRNRGGRPRIDTELRALIGQMSLENPLWGAPRIHGELLKLGFEVSQSTVAKYMPKRHGRPPGQSWWTFLRKHAPEIAAMDLFVVPTLCRDEKPDGRLDCAPAHRGFSVGFSTGLSDPRSGPRLRSSRLPAYACNGHPGQTYCISFALAEWICRATDWVYSPRMSRSRDHWRRSTPPSRTGNVRAILQRGAHAPVARKRRSPNSPGPASWQSDLVPRSRRTSSPLRPNLGFRDTLGSAGARSRGDLSGMDGRRSPPPSLLSGSAKG